ncbi:hypothetical protein BAE44_0013376 [Dichanthelium oligosanthes]|uniref:Uncharacterized protein n=1 Tax=Dichanthelium oligosanthes TaxID=888268 RepID=A0A1E5VKG4_9POAL|nr:hypothetical protein BAE44_0013376 [Dichanthelium oligosanthes]
MGSSADNSSTLAPAVRQRNAGASSSTNFKCEGVVFTVTERNEVAEGMTGGGPARVLGGESFFDEATGTRQHLVDVQAGEGRGQAWSPCARTSAALSPSGGSFGVY